MLPLGWKWLSTKILQYYKIDVYFALSYVVQMSCAVFCLCQADFLSPWGNASTCLLCSSWGETEGWEDNCASIQQQLVDLLHLLGKVLKQSRVALSVGSQERGRRRWRFYGGKGIHSQNQRAEKELLVPPHTVAFTAADSPPYKDMRPHGCIGMPFPC